MIRLITRARLTQAAVKGLMESPEDREPAVRKLFEAVGAKLISYYMTTGDADILLISEAPDAESVIAALMTSGAAGIISDATTIRAWTPAEFKAVAEKAAKAAASYRVPGKA